MFKQYQHIERFGTDEVENIELGKCYIFPKIDGTNASIWSIDGKIQAGSRKRHLSLENDNAGFLEWVKKQDNIEDFFNDYPNHRLYGEWLVPHSLKTYRENAWRNFYVFDVVHEKDEGDEHLKYEDYKSIMEKYSIEYIPPITIIENANYDQLINQLKKNTYLRS